MVRIWLSESLKLKMFSTNLSLTVKHSRYIIMFKTNFLDFVATNAFKIYNSLHCLLCICEASNDPYDVLLHYYDFAHFVYPGVSFQNCSVCEKLSVSLMKYTSNSARPLPLLFACYMYSSAWEWDKIVSVKPMTWLMRLQTHCKH